jgi:ParB/RepB/Spo0J family partition protein
MCDRKTLLLGGMALASIPLKQLKGSEVPESSHLRDLADNMKTYGLLQPLLVTPVNKENMYHIVCGHRRYAAAQLLHWTDIQCLVRTDLPCDYRMFNVSENLHRSPSMSFIEMICMIKDMSLTKSVEDISSTLSIPVDYVHRYLKLSRLDKDILAFYDSKHSTPWTLQTLLALSHLVPIVPSKELVEIAREISRLSFQEDRIQVIQDLHLQPQFVRFFVDRMLHTRFFIPFALLPAVTTIASVPMPAVTTIAPVATLPEEKGPRCKCSPCKIRVRRFGDYCVTHRAERSRQRQRDKYQQNKTPSIPSTKVGEKPLFIPKRLYDKVRELVEEDATTEEDDFTKRLKTE